ncbi:MAG: hypothetical protein WBZ29_16040 [Methanocella sp.]
MHPVRLSEKAWNFVESRRGDRLHDDYVSMLIENIADLSGEGSVMPDGLQFIEMIEAQRRIYGQHDGRGSDVARRVIDYLRDAYQGKVPRAVFVRKCMERGMSDEEIEQAACDFIQWLA